MGENNEIKAALDALQNAMIKRNTAIDARNAEDALNEDAEWAAFAALEAALDSGGEPDLPVVSIEDAEPVYAGETLVFPVTLDEPMPDGIQLKWTLGANADALVSAAELAWISPLDGQLRVTTKADAPGLPADLQVDLQPSPDFTVGRATAMGRVLPADDGGGSGDPQPVLPIEPVNPSRHAVGLTVTNITHEWDGAGTGLNAFDHASRMFNRVKQHKARLDRIGIHVLRIFSPQARDACVNAYKPYADLFKPRLIVASGFVYRSGGAVRGNIRALAEGVKYCIGAGLRIDIVTIQNEEDGNPGNKPRFDKPGETIGDHHQFMRDDLNSLGLHHVKVATLEHRHPPNNGIPEFDALKAAGRIGKGKAVEIACGHVYDKTQGLALADRLRGVGLTWSSWETGNNSSGTSSLARELSAANLGSAFGCIHYVMVTTPTPNSEQLGQAFLDYNGGDRPWAGHWEVAFGRGLTPGSVIYRCSSSDRAPGMPAEMDQWMVRNAAASGGRNPRLAAVVAQRPDGLTAIVATNTTHGSDAFSPYTGGHYGNLDQQHTMHVPWLAGKDGSFRVWRASQNGIVSEVPRIGMANGAVRWSLKGGESIALVGGAG